MGFGLPDDNLHAPNEKFHIPNFYRGIESICLFLKKSVSEMVVGARSRTLQGISFRLGHSIVFSSKIKVMAMEFAKMTPT